VDGGWGRETLAWQLAVGVAVFCTSRSCSPRGQGGGERTCAGRDTRADLAGAGEGSRLTAPATRIFLLLRNPSTAKTRRRLRVVPRTARCDQRAPFSDNELSKSVGLFGRPGADRSLEICSVDVSCMRSGAFWTSCAQDSAQETARNRRDLPLRGTTLAHQASQLAVALGALGVSPAHSIKAMYSRTSPSVTPSPVCPAPARRLAATWWKSLSSRMLGRLRDRVDDEAMCVLPARSGDGHAGFQILGILMVVVDTGLLQRHGTSG